MRSVLSAVVLLLGLTVTSASTAFTRGFVKDLSLLSNLPRGGGLFGGGDKQKEEVEDEPVFDPENMKMFPPMTKSEVEEWLAHIPVYAITDSKGQALLVRTAEQNATSGAINFFLTSAAANSTLTHFKEQMGAQDLVISKMNLGALWFRIMNPEDGEGVLLKNSEGGEPVSEVEKRLFPDQRDLMGARMLLTMKPEDGEKIKKGEVEAAEVAQNTIKRSMTESPRFNSPFNEIPIFLIAQMRMYKPPAEGEEPITILPMFFSLQTMVTTWQNLMAEKETESAEPFINLMSLKDMIDMMMKESPIDFRNVMLVGPETALGKDTEQKVTATAPSPMGGATLGDL